MSTSDQYLTARADVLCILIPREDILDARTRARGPRVSFDKPRIRRPYSTRAGHYGPARGIGPERPQAGWWNLQKCVHTGNLDVLGTFWRPLITIVCYRFAGAPPPHPPGRCVWAGHLDQACRLAGPPGWAMRHVHAMLRCANYLTCSSYLHRVRSCGRWWWTGGAAREEGCKSFGRKPLH